MFFVLFYIICWDIEYVNRLFWRIAVFKYWYIDSYNHTKTFNAIFNVNIWASLDMVNISKQ